MGEWANGIFGCFGECSLCIFTYFLPCVTVGRNAEALGDNCLTAGCFFFIPILNIIQRVSQRGRIRERQGIEGSMCNDLLCVWGCPLCSIIQEAREIKVMSGGAMADAPSDSKSTQEIERC